MEQDQPKKWVQTSNPFLDFLNDPSFQGVNLLLVQIKDSNVMIDGRNFFDQPVKNNLITFDNIQNITTGQGDDYTTGCLLDYNNFNNYYKMISIHLSKQQALDADPKLIRKISFTVNLAREGNANTTKFFKKLF